MDTRLTKLKMDFENISTIRNNIKSIFDTLLLRIDKLKDFYAEFIQTNTQNIFIFGLDSLHFQSKLIDIEYEDMCRLFLAISNRMYCEYYKLYKIIVDYIYKNIQDSKLIETTKLNQFPIYKDLEPYKEYPFETVQDVHAQVLTLIGAIISVLTHREHELKSYQSKQRIGLSIDNFVTSFNFKIVVMREEINSFLTYVEFFHTLHAKYLKRFSNKIQLMYMHVNTDIRFDDTMGLDHQNSLDESEASFIKKNIQMPFTARSVSSGGSKNSPEIKTPKVYSKNELRTIFSDINMSCDNIMCQASDTAGLDLDSDPSGSDDVMSIGSGPKIFAIDAVRESHPIQIISDKAEYSNVEEQLSVHSDTVEEEDVVEVFVGSVSEVDVAVEKVDDSVVESSVDAVDEPGVDPVIEKVDDSGVEVSTPINFSDIDNNLSETVTVEPTLIENIIESDETSIFVQNEEKVLE